MRELWNHSINHSHTFTLTELLEYGGGGRLGIHTGGRSSHVSVQIAGSDTFTSVRLGGVELADIQHDIYSAVWSQAVRALLTPTLISAGGKRAMTKLTDMPERGKGGVEEFFTCSLLNRKRPLCPKAFVLYYPQHLVFQKSMSPWCSSEALTPAFKRKLPYDTLYR